MIKVKGAIWKLVMDSTARVLTSRVSQFANKIVLTEVHGSTYL